MPHQTLIFAENLARTLLSLDVADVEINDIVFLGGHLVRRVRTKPAPSQQVPLGYLYWEGLRLDAATDGSAPCGRFQTATGECCLILRPC